MKTTDCAPLACAEPGRDAVGAAWASFALSASCCAIRAASLRKPVNESKRSALGLTLIAGGGATATFCSAWWSSAARHRYPALTAAATSADSRTAFGVSTDNSVQAGSDGA